MPPVCMVHGAGDPYEMAARWQDPTGAGTKLEVDVSGCYDTAHASDDEDAGPGPGGSASADTAGDKLDSQVGRRVGCCMTVLLATARQ